MQSKQSGMNQEPAGNQMYLSLISIKVSVHMQKSKHQITEKQRGNKSIITCRITIKYNYAENISQIHPSLFYSWDRGCVMYETEIL